MTTEDQKKTKPRRCIIPGCNKTGKIVRGLCPTHSSQYTRQRNAIPEDRREEFDAMLIKQGRLKPPDKPGRPPQEANPFRDLAEEMGLVPRNAVEDLESGTIDAFTESETQTDNSAGQRKPRKKRKG